MGGSAGAHVGARGVPGAKPGPLYNESYPTLPRPREPSWGATSTASGATKARDKLSLDGSQGIFFFAF